MQHFKTISLSLTKIEIQAAPTKKPQHSVTASITRQKDKRQHLAPNDLNTKIKKIS